MKIKFKLDEYEVNIIIKALVELRNRLIEEGRFSDAVDELIYRCGGDDMKTNSKRTDEIIKEVIEIFKRQTEARQETLLEMVKIIVQGWST